ncbi:Receptor-like kinase [Thalictrum thalictroides]|uniref:non-specific serine/threonine protein kinase n=1 Tax=Thalictrum thalictroides TaxID=46969 RepID=A0A7J6UY71_THATH|nr:Receptor-like kinase [Thalictrum thalictroides]
MEPLNYGKLNDAATFLGDHSGGSEVLLKAKGKDATTDSKKVHSHSGNAVTMMDKFYAGVCNSITSSLSQLENDKPQLYSREQLKEFTKDFSQPLGSGGFGDVYKGQFPDGLFIAVKVLKNIQRDEKVMEEQFVAEVVTMGRAYHCNLIKLHGYCYEANTKFKALVYDYMENGSFDTILFEKKLDIPWAKLHNIAKEIAQGISYLHESCKPQIIHHDIKPANVLLDSNLSPKVIDFGLAKVNNGESQFEQTKIKGSRDYMAPEVNQSKQVKLSCKLDVYSFGKVLFDILGSKRNHIDKSGFPGQVWEKYKTNQLDKFILECGIKEEDKENAKRLAIIALLCCEHNPQARPMLSNVVKMLEGEIKQLNTPVVPFYPDYYSSESSSMSDSRDC